MEIKVYDSTHTPYQYSSIEVRKHISNGEEYETFDGYLCNKNGICRIYQSQFCMKEKYVWFVRLWFIYNGKSYDRTIEGKKYTKIGLARKAGELIRDVVYTDQG